MSRGHLQGKVLNSIIRLKLLLFTALYKPYCTLHFIKKEKKIFKLQKYLEQANVGLKFQSARDSKR